jgi:hypothetical protein
MPRCSHELLLSVSAGSESGETNTLLSLVVFKQLDVVSACCLIRGPSLPPYAHGGPSIQYSGHQSSIRVELFCVSTFP